MRKIYGGQFLTTASTQFKQLAPLLFLLLLFTTQVSSCKDSNKGTNLEVLVEEQRGGSQAVVEEPSNTSNPDEDESEASSDESSFEGFSIFCGQTSPLGTEAFCGLLNAGNVAVRPESVEWTYTLSGDAAGRSVVFSEENIGAALITIRLEPEIDITTVQDSIELKATYSSDGAIEAGESASLVGAAFLRDIRRDSIIRRALPNQGDCNRFRLQFDNPCVENEATGTFDCRANEREFECSDCNFAGNVCCVPEKCELKPI